MCKYWEDENVALLGEDVLYEHEKEFKAIIENDVKIGWLLSDKEKKSKGHLVHADCKKVPDEWKWCCKYDFLITIYHPNIEYLDDDQRRTLIWHELKHIGVENGLVAPKYSIISHDIEDFKDILQSQGLDWSKRKESDEDV